MSGEEPAFLSINREVWNPAFDTLFAASKPICRTNASTAFLDQLALFGFDQLSFLTRRLSRLIWRGKSSRTFYISSGCRFAQLGLYIEAFHDRPAYYFSQPAIRHRWNPDAKEVQCGQLLDLATAVPGVVQRAADVVGLEPGLFDASADAAASSAKRQPVTFVDNILENLWRSVAIGTPVAEEEWDRCRVIARSGGPTTPSSWAGAHAVHDGDRGSGALQRLGRRASAAFRPGAAHSGRVRHAGPDRLGGEVAGGRDQRGASDGLLHGRPIQLGTPYAHRHPLPLRRPNRLPTLAAVLMPLVANPAFR
ncbi:MAG: hypothetical protein WDN45_18985 [Caulobacteraceae bacterium]